MEASSYQILHLCADYRLGEPVTGISNQAHTRPTGIASLRKRPEPICNRYQG